MTSTVLESSTPISWAVQAIARIPTRSAMTMASNRGLRRLLPRTRCAPTSCGRYLPSAYVAATNPTSTELPLNVCTNAGMIVVSESSEIANAKVPESSMRKRKLRRWW